MGDTGSPQRTHQCRETTHDNQPDHLGGEGEKPHTGHEAFGAKGHGGKQRRRTRTFLESSRQPGRSTSNHSLGEWTRGNDWTSEPHQILPGGKAGKEGEKASKRQTQFQTKGGGYVQVALYWWEAFRKPLRETALQNEFKHAQRNKSKEEGEKRSSEHFKFDSWL